jgi:hypothetical protein
MLFSLPSFRAATTILGLTILVGCSSKKEDAPPTTPVGMSWTVDGGTVSTTTVDSDNRPASISVTGIVPASASLASLSLGFPNAVGTYTIDPTASASANYNVAVGNAAGSYYAGASVSGTVTGAGTIVVTALTATTVTGTFTFTGIGPAGAAKTITNGTFNVGL